MKKEYVFILDCFGNNYLGHYKTTIKAETFEDAKSDMFCRIWFEVYPAYAKEPQTPIYINTKKIISFWEFTE